MAILYIASNFNCMESVHFLPLDLCFVNILLWIFLSQHCFCIHTLFFFTSVKYYFFMNMPQYICSFFLLITFNVKDYRLYCCECTFPSLWSKYILISVVCISGRESFGNKACIYLTLVDVIRASLIAQLVKNLPIIQETQFDSWFRKIPWRQKWQPTPVFLL